MSSLLTDTRLRVGCVGGGQLGRMMALEAPRLNISMSFLDPLGSDAPAADSSSSVIQGSLCDPEKLRELASNVDVVTIEIEHVGVDALETLENEGVNVQPSSRVVRIIQDKYVQKKHFSEHKIPLPPFHETPNIESIKLAAIEFGLPLMLKSRLGAYDGRGNAVLNSTDDDSILLALKSLGCNSDTTTNLPLYAEAWMDFYCEIAVIVVRSSQTGETPAYPTVTAIQTDSICRVVLAPARNVSDEIRQQAERIASEAISSLGDGATGIFGVELFLLKNTNTIVLNEVAPRPHNTGHFTQDACSTSQFENHLRAICGLPLGDVTMNVGAAAMVNVLGSASGKMEDTMDTINAAMSMPQTIVHWYGKKMCRAGRKMAHINLTAPSSAELDKRLKELLQLEGIANCVQSILQRPTPLVCVIMGSSSDLPTMQAAVEILDEFEITCEVDIVSAHRTPMKLASYATSACSRGVQVIIAGAGGAAHLPGMVAAMTPLPVIGVPIKTLTLNGQDSLLSIVQMPRGIPVATVAIGNATNAGLLAVRILCATRPELRRKMEQYQDDMRQKVEDTSDKLLEQGSKSFLEGMSNKNFTVNV